MLTSHDSRAARHTVYAHGIQCMPCFSRTISEMLHEIHTMEKKSLILSNLGEFREIWSVGEYGPPGIN